MASSMAGLKCEPDAEAGGGAGRFKVSVDRDTLSRRWWCGDASHWVLDKPTNDSILKGYTQHTNTVITCTILIC